MIEMTAIERIDIHAREADATNVKAEAVEVVHIVGMWVGTKWDDGEGVPAGWSIGMFLKKNWVGDFDTVWATITITDVTGLTSALGWKSDVGHVHAITDVTGLTSALSGKEDTITAGTTGQYWRGDKTWQTLNKSAVWLGNVDNTSDLAKPISTATQSALDLKINLSEKGVANGVATLDASGLIPSSQLGALAISEYLGNFSNTTTALANAWVQASQRGDWFTVADDGTGKSASYIVTTDSPTTLSHITKISTPTDAVLSVNWQTGIVSLSTTEISEGTNLYFTDARAISALGSALALKVPTSRTLTINGVSYDLSADRSWTINSSPAGSSGYVQYNTGWAFDAKSTFIFNSALDALGIQVATPFAALHVASITGQTLNNVTSGSASLIDETIESAPTWSGTLIAEPTAWSGGGVSFVNEWSGNAISSANNTTYYFRIYPCLYVASTGSFYRSQYYEEVSSTDPNNSQSYDIQVSWWTVSISGETVYYHVEYSTDGGSFYPLWVSANTSETYTSLSGGDSTTSWWSQYQNSGWTLPSVPSSLSGYTGWYGGSFQDTSTGVFSATGRMWEIAVDSYNTISGTIYVSGTPTTNSFTDDSMNSYRVASAWSSGGSQEGFIYRRRYSDDGGMSWSDWSYTYANDFDGTYYYKYDEDYSNDTALEARWWQTYSAWSLAINFLPYGRTSAPSGNIAYSSVWSSYGVSIPADSVRYIIKHTFSWMPAQGAKILAPAEWVNYWKVVTSSFYDTGYNSWGDGTVVTPTGYWFSGTAQNIEFKIYSYSSASGIYGTTPLTVSTTASGGSKYASVSWTLPAWVTQVKVTRSINGAWHNFWKIITGTSVTFDNTDNSWSSGTVVTPTAIVPSTSRFDKEITSITSGTKFQLQVIGTWSGTRYAGISFWIATNSDTDATLQAHIYHESNTWYLNFSTGRISIVNTIGGTASTILWVSNVFNNNNSSSTHFQVKGQSDSNLINTRSDQNTVGFGQAIWSDQFCTVQIQPTSSGDAWLVLISHSSMSDSSTLMRMQTYAGSYTGEITVGGWWRGGSGSASTPAISARADNNTGLAFLSADTFSAITGWTERGRWNSLGLGIGITTSFVGQLHVKGTGSWSIQAVFDQASGQTTDMMRFRNSSSTVITSIASNGYQLWINTGGAYNTAHISIYHQWGIKGIVLKNNWTPTTFLELQNSAWSVIWGFDTIANLVSNTGTGIKIGTATTQKLGFWNATPIVQPTTAWSAATFVTNTSLIANDSATFDGYTIGQVIKALRNMGILA